MIGIITDAQEYGYDLYALTKSFFTKEEVSILQEESIDSREENRIIFIVNTDEDNKIRLIITEGSDIPFSYDTIYHAENLRENNQEFKLEIKRFFYDVFVEKCGNPLPWGNLTGIRPTKLIMAMLDEQAKKTGYTLDDLSPDICGSIISNTDGIASEEKRIDYAKQDEICKAVRRLAYETHRVGEKKTNLGMEIALREHAILNGLHKTNGYSVYIGIPFCPSTCLYCSFTSFPIVKWQKRIQEYLAALKKELEFTKEQMKDYYLDSVYIGGGTPSTLSAEELDQLLGDITSILPWEHVKEFTVEAGRADSITRDKLKVLKKYPVTRISVNPQTMKDDTLKLIGRHHNVAQVLEAYQMAREEGFDNINMDIILGLPGETTEDVKNTVTEIAKLKPDSLTVHSLAIKRASKMKAYIDEHGGFDTMDYEIAMEIAEKAAREMGLNPYYLYRQKNMAGNLENTGYAAPGKYGIYNILIMEEVQSIVALGAGSVSKRVFPDGRIERCDNVKDINLYLDQIDEMIERKRKLFS